jgi:hypothetical protein
MNIQYGMQKHTDRFSILIFSVIVASFATMFVFSYEKYMVFSDYTLYAQVSCEPDTESCFVYECDPETETDCDPDEPYWYFKAVYMYAPDAPQCTPTAEHDCPELACEPGIRCEEVMCDETNMGEYQELEYCA